MKTLNSATMASIVAALCIVSFMFSASPVEGDGWQDDIQFMSCECGMTDVGCGDCCGTECGGCASECCGDECCGDVCCGCGDWGYCYNGPCPTDGMTRRFMSSAETMMAHGITYDAEATQFYQGVASGGVEQTFEYGGKVDQFLILDSGKMGLWQGMTMTMHAETRFGQDINNQAVGLAPVNVAMLYPKSGEHDTAITGLSFAQALSDDVQFTFGKFNALDLFYSLYPQTGRGVNGFMNASMVVPVSVARVVPLSFMGAGALKYRGKQVQGGLLVFDTQNSTTTSGFDNLGDNGANILGFWRFFTCAGGLPGSHMFGGVWSTGDFVAFDPAGFVIVPDEGIVAVPRSGAYTLLYILEQTLWMDCCNKARNVTLLSQWGLAEKQTSPFHWTANVAVQATGFNGCRPHDSMGIGYFHTELSDDFQNLLSPVLTLQDVDGVELYYNAAITKCFQLTTDLQIIEPADVTNDTAVVFGLRGTIGL